MSFRRPPARYREFSAELATGRPSSVSTTARTPAKRPIPFTPALQERPSIEGTSPVIFEPAQGDRYLLCSDGVTDGVDDLTLALLLAKGDDPQQIAETIVEAAQQGGSKDNITAVVLLLEQ